MLFCEEGISLPYCVFVHTCHMSDWFHFSSVRGWVSVSAIHRGYNNWRAPWKNRISSTSMKLRESLIKPVTRQNISSSLILPPEIVVHDALMLLPAGLPRSRKLPVPVLFLLTGQKSGFFRPAGATRCTDSGQTLHYRRASGSAWLCRISCQSVQTGGNAAPKISKISTFW